VTACLDGFEGCFFARAFDRFAAPDRDAADAIPVRQTISLHF
jgi:hypothetical protein